MPGRTVQFEGRSFSFPDDATDDEISQVLASASGQPRPNDPSSIISGPEPGLGGSINRLSAKVKGWLGGNKSERGSGSGAVDLLGGPALGPLKMAHGTTQLTTHPVKGLNEIVRGGVQTAALPLSVVSPSAAPMSLPYAAGGAVVNKAAQYAGADLDTAELAGNLAVGAAAGRGPLTRTVGRGIQKVGSLPDLPTNIPLSPKTNMLLSAMNSMKSDMGGVGRKMANYGIPQAPNIAPGPGEPPPEADLPAIRPDESSHYNDVQDQGESNRLMDAVRGHDFIKPSDRSPVQPSSNSQYDDVAIANPEIKSAPDEDLISQVQRGAVLPSADAAKDVNSLDLIDRVQRGAVLPSAQAARTVNSLPTTSPSPFTDATPTPNSNTLLRAIQSAPGWPENGLPNKPWSAIHAEDELPDALATDPYNRPMDRQIQDPSYQGPERRQTPMPSFRNPIIHDIAPDIDEMLGVMTNSNNPLGVRKVGSGPIKVSDITPSEDEQDFDKVRRYAGMQTEPPPIDIYNIEHEGQPYKVIGQGPGGGGHHRTLAAIMSGKDEVPANFYDTVDEQSPGSGSGLAETTAASDPTGDGQALDQARQELPNGTLSDHLQRAAQIAAQKRNTGPQQ